MDTCPVCGQNVNVVPFDGEMVYEVHFTQQKGEVGHCSGSNMPVSQVEET